MPRATVWIRNSDYELWDRIENKSELVSEAINRSVKTAGDNYPEHHLTPPDKPIKHESYDNHVPSMADLMIIIKENERKIEILAESQDPEDQVKAQELFDDTQGLWKMWKLEKAKLNSGQSTTN